MRKKEEAEIDALLANLWKRNLPVLEERIALLDRAATAAASGNLDDTARAEALDIAHKLSGSLGMFGYHQGTAVAREIEQMLCASGPDQPADRLATLVADLRRALFPRTEL